MIILILLTTLVAGGSGSLVVPHADSCFDIAFVVPTPVKFLVFRVRPVAFLAARGAVTRPIPEASDADAVLLAKRSHYTARNLATSADRPARLARHFELTSRECSRLLAADGSGTAANGRTVLLANSIAIAYAAAGEIRV